MIDSHSADRAVISDRLIEKDAISPYPHLLIIVSSHLNHIRLLLEDELSPSEESNESKKRCEKDGIRGFFRSSS